MSTTLYDSSSINVLKYIILDRKRSFMSLNFLFKEYFFTVFAEFSFISRSYECVRMLLDAKGDVNHQDSFGYSPLHIAALNEYSYCASLLLSYGADVTIRTNGGTSALSMIVRQDEYI